MAPSLRFGVAYDFRNPSTAGMSNRRVYRDILEQIALADQLGFDSVWFTEHHFVDDGYLPSWIPVAGAVAARTTRIRIGTDIALAPFYNPIRLAEDVAVLDIISDGRMDLGLGMGYAPHEFKAFGIPLSHRVSLLEESIEILRAAWSGDVFSFHGRRWSFDDLRVTPSPVQPGGPPLWLAAMTAAGAQRAARFGCNFLPQGDRHATLDVWRNAVADRSPMPLGRRPSRQASNRTAEGDRASASEPGSDGGDAVGAEGTRPQASGHDADQRRVGIIRSWLVTDDRERDWPPIREAERYRFSTYQRFFDEAATSFSLGGANAIPQTWIVGDEAYVEAELGAFIETYGLTDVVTWGVPPGVAPERLHASLERFACNVAPALRARFS